MLYPWPNRLRTYPVRATHLVDAQPGETPFIEVHLCPAARLQHYHHSRMVELLEHKMMYQPGLTNCSDVLCPSAPRVLILPSSDQDGGIFDGRCYRHACTRRSNVGIRHCRLNVRHHQIFACGLSTDIVKQPDL